MAELSEIVKLVEYIRQYLRTNNCAVSHAHLENRMVRVLSIFRKENYLSYVSYVKYTKIVGEYILFCSSRSKCTSWLSINVQILRSSSVFRTSSSESNTLSRPSGPHLCAASGCNAVDTTPFTTANKLSAHCSLSLENKT